MSQINLEEVETFATANMSRIADWIDLLPGPCGSAQEWLVQLVESDPNVRRAMGVDGGVAELEAMKTFIRSDAPHFRMWQSNLNQRLQIYLGGVQGLAASRHSRRLSEHSDKLRSLREMFQDQPHAWTRTPRTLAAVAKAVDADSLRWFRTSEIDSELWVVLKTIQENLTDRAGITSLIRLIDWVVECVRAEICQPGQHIADRRYAWWAMRTLYQAVEVGYVPQGAAYLTAFLRQLLAEPVYVANPIATGVALEPYFHDKTAAGWALVNIAELRRGWHRYVDGSVLPLLEQREDSLMYDLLSAHAPSDMRVATVYARGGLTYLADECPRLWTRDA